MQPEETKTKEQLLEETIEDTKQALINGEHNLAISRKVLEYAEAELKEMKGGMK